jgi:hypothetical protein
MQCLWELQLVVLVVQSVQNYRCCVVKVAEISSCQNETAMLTTFNEVNMTPINLIVMNTKMRLKHGGIG